MVPITIGVPVYNGADLLDESLACLARQTFRDFKVLMLDAASDSNRNAASPNGPSSVKPENLPWRH